MVSAGGKNSPYISATLPQGNKSNDYNITIKVDIFDQKGAGQVDILTVKVRFLLELGFSNDFVSQQIDPDINDLELEDVPWKVVCL